jgi:hypothetical protein
MKYERYTLAGSNKMEHIPGFADGENENADEGEYESERPEVDSLAE